ncbi:MAG: uncharacterized protein QOC96_1273 [Acidobacteriota bacterium]|jgi:uncharacterized protein YqjF (DUF2071 family)|nr:uncharacterized protein [Acidobacteriota bacterium]
MGEKQPTDLDRLSIRKRPDGQPIMHQTWGKLLFMHWRIAEEMLRPLIPERLTIDTFDGSAWIAVTPFTMWDIRAFPPYLPPVPGLDRMHELNVRTYVHLDGVPGVWFFSLDANSSIAVMTARAFFHLPYFNAEMSLEQDKETIVYSSLRTEENEPSAEFAATWKTGETLPFSHPGSLEFFLTERYCLYSAHKQKLYRCRIFHPPWPLWKASLSSFASTMIESHGLPTPEGVPLLHYAEELSVDIWPIAECKRQN